MIDVKLEQWENAESPSDVTLVGIVIDDNLEQEENAELPIDVTLVGIVIDAKLEQWKNAESPIDVTLVGMQYDENRCLARKHRIVSRFFENRIPSIEQNCWLLDSTRMDSKLQQPENAELQIRAILENNSYLEDECFGGIKISWSRFLEFHQF